jgi:hypothetical protein
MPLLIDSDQWDRRAKQIGKASRQRASGYKCRKTRANRPFLGSFNLSSRTVAWNHHSNRISALKFEYFGLCSADERYPPVRVIAKGAGKCTCTPKALASELSRASRAPVTFSTKGHYERSKRRRGCCFLSV